MYSNGKGIVFMSHETYLQQAIDLALQNTTEGGGQPFGAVIVKDGEVLATGVNEIAACYDPTAHAEIQAIRTACKKVKSSELPGCILYASSRPCPLCVEAIGWTNLKAVYYAATFDESGSFGFDPSADWDEPFERIEMHGEQMKPLEAWGRQHPTT